MSFELAVQDIIKTEGGFVNDPLDNGGATNYGITIGTLSNYLGRQATLEEIKNISLDTVKMIYKSNYWDRLKLDQIRDSKLAHILFDQAVNRGTRKVAEQIQKLVSVHPDGIIGPLTINVINTVDPRRLLLQFLMESQNSYVSIVNANPNQLKFLSGWIKRTHKFL